SPYGMANRPVPNGRLLLAIGVSALFERLACARREVARRAALGRLGRPCEPLGAGSELRLPALTELLGDELERPARRLRVLVLRRRLEPGECQPERRQRSRSELLVGDERRSLLLASAQRRHEQDRPEAEKRAQPEDGGGRRGRRCPVADVEERGEIGSPGW